MLKLLQLIAIFITSILFQYNLLLIVRLLSDLIKSESKENLDKLARIILKIAAIISILIVFISI